MIKLAMVHIQERLDAQGARVRCVRVRARARVHACVRVRAHQSVRPCVCLPVCVCVCICVRARVRSCVRARARARVLWRGKAGGGLLLRLPRKRPVGRAGPGRAGGMMGWLGSGRVGVGDGQGGLAGGMVWASWLEH